MREDATQKYGNLGGVKQAANSNGPDILAPIIRAVVQSRLLTNNQCAKFDPYNTSGFADKRLKVGMASLRNLELFCRFLLHFFSFLLFSYFLLHSHWFSSIAENIKLFILYSIRFQFKIIQNNDCSDTDFPTFFIQRFEQIDEKKSSAKERFQFWKPQWI